MSDNKEMTPALKHQINERARLRRAKKQKNRARNKIARKQRRK